jgi:hypothetical protein
MSIAIIAYLLTATIALHGATRFAALRPVYA